MTAITYKITSKNSDRVYFGSTETSLSTRAYYHTTLLRLGRHYNHELQAEYDRDSTSLNFTQMDVHATRDDAVAHEMGNISISPNAMNIRGNAMIKEHYFSIDAPIALEILKCKGVLKGYETARLYNVSPSSVSRIWRGNSVAHRPTFNDMRAELAARTKALLESFGLKAGSVSPAI